MNYQRIRTKLAQINNAQNIVRSIAMRAAYAYAKPQTGDAQAIVSLRFQGAENARFAPLTLRYAMAKAGRTFGAGGRNVRHVSARPGTRANRAVAVATTAGRKIRGQLPILVRSGALRDAVAATPTFSPQGTDVVIIRWQLPDYAQAHDQGTGRMPQRRPVKPNESDRQKWLAEVRKLLRAATLRGQSGQAQFGAGAVSFL